MHKDDHRQSKARGPCDPKGDRGGKRTRTVREEGKGILLNVRLLAAKQWPTRGGSVAGQPDRSPAASATHPRARRCHDRYVEGADAERIVETELGR